MAEATQIFRLTCSHDYFSGNIEGLRIQPTKATKKWIDSHRILMRSLGTDITLYKTAETPEDHQELLTFLLLVEDVEFYNYSLLPAISTKDQLCYLSNKDGGLSEQSEVDNTHFLPKTYGIILNENTVTEEKPLYIKNQADEVVREFSWNGKAPLSSSLTDLPPGKYNWTYGNEEQGSFFGAPESTRKAFGLVEIDLKTVEDITYNIHFNVRGSTWEYYIIDKQNTGNSYEIVDEQETYRFGTGEPAEVLGGKPATKITSEELIPFKERPDYEFKLVTKVNSGGMRQPWNGSMLLPTPKSEQLRVSGEQELKYITPIYIYI